MFFVFLLSCFYSILLTYWLYAQISTPDGHEQGGRCGLGSFFFFFVVVVFGFIITSMWALKDFFPLYGLKWHDGSTLEWFTTGRWREQTQSHNLVLSGKTCHGSLCSLLKHLFIVFVHLFLIQCKLYSLLVCKQLGFTSHLDTCEAFVKIHQTSLCL